MTDLLLTLWVEPTDVASLGVLYSVQAYNLSITDYL